MTGKKKKKRAASLSAKATVPFPQLHVIVAF
jgi:hypothetical protein